jgi:hypothetical protein
MQAQADGHALGQCLRVLHRTRGVVAERASAVAAMELGKEACAAETMASLSPGSRASRWLGTLRPRL